MIKKNKKKEVPLFLRGRHFSARDLKVINRCVQKYFDKGRTYISKVICEKLNWKQPNGWLKDRACRDVLLQLNEKGVIELPPARTRLKKRCVLQQEKRVWHNIDVASPIIDYPDKIDLELAKGNKAEKIWNEMVKEYHYLGHKVLVGRCMKYLVKTGETILGAVSFSSPAWQLEPRDAILQKLEVPLGDIRDLVINNSRFLILPNVNVPNLASTVLSVSTQKIVNDWKDYYSITPLIVETFVQPSLYNGTCYKAANWLQIGMTKGYAKAGTSYHNSQEPKKIFIYGLSKKVRRKIHQIINDQEDKGS
ncbi:MAG: Druantia anti-phage system protein DruA [Acidobacteriota bacterium]